MAIFNRNKPDRPSTAEETPAASAAAVDWSDIESIRREWPRATLDPPADLANFRQALAL